MPTVYEILYDDNKIVIADNDYNKQYKHTKHNSPAISSMTNKTNKTNMTNIANISNMQNKPKYKEYTIEISEFGVGKVIKYGHNFFRNLLFYITDNTEVFTCEDAVDISSKVHKIIKKYTYKNKDGKKKYYHDNLLLVIDVNGVVFHIYVDFGKL